MFEMKRLFSDGYRIEALAAQRRANHRAHYRIAASAAMPPKQSRSSNANLRRRINGKRFAGL
jgi:hypothetical protein